MTVSRMLVASHDAEGALGIVDTSYSGYAAPEGAASLADQTKTRPWAILVASSRSVSGDVRYSRT